VICRMLPIKLAGTQGDKYLFHKGNKEKRGNCAQVVNTRKKTKEKDRELRASSEYAQKTKEKGRELRASSEYAHKS
ncbi:hypothetical protein K4G98_28435, partial [Mycobacterium tuberculosis]|nr:hypothetical protein [Mycobacterium tuberculosis]